MRRREFIAALGGATVWGARANAQRPSRTRRIGLLMAYAENDPEVRERVAAFGESLRQAGWIEGQNMRIDVRWRAGDPERAKTNARELVQLHPDILVVNGVHALTAARLSTSSLPIVFVVVADPIGAGFIPSLFRPGGNITGFSTF